MGQRKSVLLITVDCLRFDHVGFMGYARPTTPFLDSLATESVIVPVALVGGAPTYYSLPAILASRYPLALGRDILGLAPEETSLASTLKKAGYRTAAFCAGNPYISARFGYDQSFDTFKDYLGVDAAALPHGDSVTKSPEHWRGAANRRLARFSRAVPLLGAFYDELYFQYCQRWAVAPPDSLDALRRFPAADVVVDDALAWLGANRDAPFFLWLHFMDPHSPYYPKEDCLKMLGADDIAPSRARYLNDFWNRSDLRPHRLQRHRDEIVALYDAGIRWVDHQVQRLREVLRNSGRWDDCILALTADHGEEFLDHGGRYHPPSELTEELIHVPLLLRLPGGVARRASNSPFSLIHLAPTLLDAADVETPPTFQGRSLWGEIQSGSSWTDAAVLESVADCTNPFRPESRVGPRVLVVREGRFKLVLHFEPQREVLYDLEMDPKERQPLPRDTHKPARRRLLERAQNHLRGSLKERDQHSRLRSRLRDLQLEWSAPAQKTSRVAP
jgi:arylsulfatase A-like enzyme